MKHFRSFVLSLLTFIVLACDSSEDNFQLKTDQEYFPLEKGFYQLYNVKEIRYVLSMPETLEYEMKVSVVDSFLDGTGEYTYVLSRSTRVGNEAFTPVETWSARKSAKEAVMIEGNTSYVVLNFPLVLKTQWDGNKYNSEEHPITGEVTDMYEISNIGETITLGSQTFQNCVTVVQENIDDKIVYSDQRLETYAPEAGLIFKSSTQLQYCSDDNCLGQEIVEQGRIYTQTLIAYGKD